MRVLRASEFLAKISVMAAKLEWFGFANVTIKLKNAVNPRSSAQMGRFAEGSPGGCRLPGTAALKGLMESPCRPSA